MRRILNILYDYQAFQMQTFGGVSRCFWELYQHFPNTIHAEFAVRESNNVYMRGLEGITPVGYQYESFISKRYFYGKGRLHKLYDKLTHGGYYPDYNQNYSIELLKKGNYDVFHPTFFSDYFLPYLKGKPFVLTIHDMTLEHYPKIFGENDYQVRMKRKLAPMADVIIAVSENTKKDIVDMLHIPEEKIHVIYHGCSFPKASDVHVLVNNKNPYILYVGQRKGYKNFDLFVKYVAPFLKTHPDVAVVCTGVDFNEQERMLFAKYNVQHQFIHYWVSEDEEFFSLYHQALCFVYTSEYEGFGIPILEAYQADCPVLLNQTSCFPEIAGDAAVYFHLTEEDSNLVEMLDKVYSMSSDEKLALLEKQKERLAHYSWEKSAKQLAAIYQSLT